MASPKSDSGFRTIERLANPWLWAFVGLATGGVALFWMRFVGDTGELFRMLLIAVSVLSAGVAVALRLTSKRGSFLDALPVKRRHMLFVLLFLNLSLIVDALALLWAKTSRADLPWPTSGLIFMCAVVVPVAGALALFCLGRLTRSPEGDNRVEGAAVLVILAMCACMACWAMYVNKDHAESWDTMRVFLAALATAAILAAPVMLLPIFLRKVAVSVVILLHFGGILTACMVLPQPWLMGQIRQRIYRPYLQFMYLENSYQFYAPEPGPSNYFWFYVKFEEPGKTKTAPKTIYKHWVKFPRMDKETEAPGYPTALQYYRRVAMSDQSALPTGTTPPLLDTDSKGKFRDNPILYWRYRVAGIQRPRLLGQPIEQIPIPKEWSIPIHPEISPLRQYRMPTDDAQRLIVSLVKHVAYSEKIKDHPKAKVVSVKVYHVVHLWPTYEMINYGVSPIDPRRYQPYYQGEYSPEGKLLDQPQFDDAGGLKAGNPLLHWMVPILADVDPRKKYNPATDFDKVPIRNYMFIHAGEPKYMKYPGKSYWQKERK